MTTKELMAYAKSKGRVKTLYLDVEKVCTQTMAAMTPLQTKVGDRVRPCFNATLSHTRFATPLVPARLGNVFVVDAMAGGAVRIGGNCWCRSWVRVSP